MKYLIILSIIFLHISRISDVFAKEYYCNTTEKYDFGIIYGRETIVGGQFATKVEELDSGSFLSRCSMSYMPDIPEITCDRYTVDKVEYNESSKIKKYYVFDLQIDFQIFPDLNSLENNGRGSIQYGVCEVVSP